MAEPVPKNFPTNWDMTWQEMQREWDRLHDEITRLRNERHELTKALVSLLGDEVTLSQDEILAQIGKEPPLRELLKELRSQVNGD